MGNSHFLFVGTAKAGTTSISEYLKQHPRISIPVKESFFFLREVYQDLSLNYPKQRSKDNLILDYEAFQKLYPDNPEVLYGEIGTGYLYHHKISIPAIKKTLGSDVKILMILRNPIDRAYSSYMHFVKDSYEKNSFEESLRLETKRKKKGYDFMWMHREMGLYYEQVKAFLQAFPQVKIIITEEFNKDREKGMKDIFNFLEIDPAVGLNFSASYNKSGKPKVKHLQKLLMQENPVKKALRPAFRAIYKKEKREKIRKRIKNLNIGDYEPMQEETRNKLSEYYRNDVEKLEALLGRKIDKWDF